jgi:hypothetical protein
MNWSLANLEDPIYVYKINEGSRSQQKQLKKKAILAYRSYQAMNKLNLSYLNLPLQFGWMVYLIAPEQVKSIIRSLFSPTTDKHPSEEHKQIVQQLQNYK